MARLTFHSLHATPWFQSLVFHATIPVANVCTLDSTKDAASYVPNTFSEFEYEDMFKRNFHNIPCSAIQAGTVAGCATTSSRAQYQSTWQACKCKPTYQNENRANLLQYCVLMTAHAPSSILSITSMPCKGDTCDSPTVLQHVQAKLTKGRPRQLHVLGVS